MTALNFPPSPFVGQLYAGYFWDGLVWRSIGSASRLATARPGRLVNPNMEVSQQNGLTAGTTDGWFAADQWTLWRVLSTGVISHGRVAKTTPQGSPYRIRATVTTAQASMAASNYVTFDTELEGFDWSDTMWGLATAKPALVRLGVNFPAGTYSLSLCNSPITRTYIGEFTISAAQAGTDVELTLPIPAPAPPGIWNIGTSTAIVFEVCIACGSTYTAPGVGWQTGSFSASPNQSNGMATNGAVFELFDVDIYPDPENTGLPPIWEPPVLSVNLAKCMRFWQQISVTSASCNVTTAVAYSGYGKYTVPPRTNVSGNLSGVHQFANGFPATVGTLAIIPDGVTETRTANATTNAGAFRTTVTVNARM